MKTIGVMILSEMLILTLASTLQTIIKMVDVHEEQMVSVVPGAAKMNIATLFDNYDQKAYFHFLAFDCMNTRTEYYLKSKYTSWI